MGIDFYFPVVRGVTLQRFTLISDPLGSVCFHLARIPAVSFALCQEFRGGGYKNMIGGLHYILFVRFDTPAQTGVADIDSQWILQLLCSQVGDAQDCVCRTSEDEEVK